MADPLAPQALDDALRVRTELVGHHDQTGDVPIDGNEHVRFARTSGAHQRCRRCNLLLTNAVLAQERVTADEHAVPISDAGDPEPGGLADLRR